MIEAHLSITEIIKKIRGQFISEGLAPSYFQINNGQCDCFATDVIKLAGDAVSECCNESFEQGDGGWDWAYLKQQWGMSPPNGLTQDEMDDIRFGGHVFLEYKKRWYDAECPDGVESFFDLPIFRRCIVMALRKKGLQADEVQPEDVVPPPLCHIPNPPENKPTRRLTESDSPTRRMLYLEAALGRFFVNKYHKLTI